MSFTQDELQSLHAIVEQKLSVHRQELERAFDLRINVFKRELESSFVSILQDQMRILPQRMVENQVEQQVKWQPVPQSNGNGTVPPLAVSPTYVSETLPDFETIEIQTEIPWDDLVDAVSKAMDKRLTTFDESLRSVIKNIEHRLSLQIHNVHNILGSEQTQSLNGAVSNIQEVFTSLEQLERLVESMQVALTANHTLLLNRLYHHQHLPLERAHANAHEPTTHLSRAHDVKNQLSFPEKDESEQ